MFQFDKCCRPSGESKSDRKLRSRYLRNAPYKKERKNDINLRRSINNDDIEIYFKIQKKPSKRDTSSSSSSLSLSVCCLAMCQKKLVHETNRRKNVGVIRYDQKMKEERKREGNIIQMSHVCHDGFLSLM